jgi:hypothetical protein
VAAAPPAIVAAEVTQDILDRGQVISDDGKHRAQCRATA